MNYFDIFQVENLHDDKSIHSTECHSSPSCLYLLFINFFCYFKSHCSGYQLLLNELIYFYFKSFFPIHLFVSQDVINTWKIHSLNFDIHEKHPLKHSFLYLIDKMIPYERETWPKFTFLYSWILLGKIDIKANKRVTLEKKIRVMIFRCNIFSLCLFFGVAELKLTGHSSIQNLT